MSDITPEELSGRLDKILPPGTQARPAGIYSSNQPILRAALIVAGSPRPKLSDAAKTRMAAKMFAAFDAMPARAIVSQPVVRRLNPFITGVAASAAAVVLIAVGMLAILSRPSEVALTPTAPMVAIITVSPTASDVPPTSTDVPPTEIVATVSDVPPTPTYAPPTEIIPTASDLPPTSTYAPPTEIILAVTDALIASPTAQPTESANLSASQEVRFIIEGQVEEVLEDAVVIAGFRVRFTQKDPLLKVLRAGDMIRIEGSFSVEGNRNQNLTFTLDQSEIVLDNTEADQNLIEISPDGEVWRDDGTCKNPPPDWANANGWHKRCDAVTGDDGNNAGGNGKGNDNGNANHNGNDNGNGKGNDNGNENDNGKGKP